MSRSLNTQKLAVRAARRLARPYGKRVDEGNIIAGRIQAIRGGNSSRLLRIVCQRLAAGYCQPLGVREVRQWLERLPAENRYRLRVIRLLGQPKLSGRGIVFGEYLPPGEIRIYAVPPNPWRLDFHAQDKELDRFSAYGARVKLDRAGVTIDWPAEGLRRYMLIEVLGHELGHHCLQHDKSRRTCARRRDHEVCAALHARGAATSD